MKNTNYLQTNMENVQGIFSTVHYRILSLIFLKYLHELDIK